MPKTNPSQRPNNYGLYGVLVLLLTVGYHHYFAKENHSEEKIKSPVPQKIEKSSKAFPIAASETQVDDLENLKNDQLKTTQIKEEVEDDQDQFVNDNDRQNCWDYISRNLAMNEKEMMELNDTLAKRLLNKYPARYLFSRDKEPEDVDPKVLTKGVLFASALKDLQMLNSWSSNDKLAPERAIKVLLNLHKNEPKNSAYLVYLALAYESVGNYKEINKIISKVEQTTYYSTHHSEFKRDLYDLPKNINEFIAADVLTYSTSEPNIYKMVDLSTRHDLSKVALQILDKSTPSNPDYDPFDTNASDYSAAYRVLEKRKPELAKKYLNTEDYTKRFIKHQHFNYGAKDNALAKECEISSINNLFIKSKEFLSKHPAKSKSEVIVRSVAGK